MDQFFFNSEFFNLIKCIVFIYNELIAQLQMKSTIKSIVEKPSKSKLDLI